MTDDEAAALLLYPAPWDAQRRAAFLAGVAWLRGQVMQGSAVPGDAMLRRRQAVVDAARWHRG